MKKTSKKIMIIALVVLLLALAIGYAAFSDTLTISGTANANGTFDLNFISGEIKENASFNFSKSTITPSGNDLTVKIADLAYPGAGTEVTAVIRNDGTIPAKITNVTFNTSDLDEDIIVTWPDGLSTNHPTIPSKGTCTIKFLVQWKEGATRPSTEHSKGGTFTATIVYGQATDDFTGTPSHSDV